MSVHHPLKLKIWNTLLAWNDSVRVRIQRLEEEAQTLPIDDAQKLDITIGLGKVQNQLIEIEELVGKYLGCEDALERSKIALNIRKVYADALRSFQELRP